MKRLVLFLPLLFLPLPANAQLTDPTDGDTISSAQVSGFDLDQLSPGLQQEIARLEGAPLNRARLDELAARIEAEQPRLVAAVRIFRAPASEVRVVFVVAHRRDQDRKANVNARYLVERAEIRGIDETDLSADLRDALAALTGKVLGSDEVERFEAKLKAALPDHDVTRRARRGSTSGEIRLLFVAQKMESARWLHFEPLKSHAVYHSDQGWGALMDFPISGRDVRVVPIVAFDTDEDLIEEYSGFGLRVESRKLGTERLGASFEWSSFDQDWRGATLAALDQNPRIPAAYAERSTVTPMLTFAVTRQLRVSGGVGITEIEPLSGLPESQMANVVIASVGFDDEWARGGARHEFGTAFTVRTASEGLESDFEYTRYLGQAEYRYRRANHTLLVAGRAGGIDGGAPLFERFSLGDSRTLRGWNKYDIAPAGGDRLVYSSLEYQYRGLAFFLDSGSVWNADSDARVRVAAGFGFHPGPFFMTVGFPLNTDDVRAVFTTGIRFGSVAIRK